jgi:hypothetical protein
LHGAGGDELADAPGGRADFGLDGEGGEGGHAASLSTSEGE